MILSAKFGLIDSTEPIPDYNCRLTPWRRKRIRPVVEEKLLGVLRAEAWQAVGICMGRAYMGTIAGFQGAAPATVKIEILPGGLGRRLSSLRRWLGEHDTGCTPARKPTKGGER
jgi:hypothetical protein